MPILSSRKKNQTKVKSILITQPKPESEKNSFFELGEKYNIEIDFIPFIHVERLSAKEFRKSRVSPNDYTAVIFTSRNAADHFFVLLEEMRIVMSQETKYFCMTEAIGLYLQKHIVYRKRKVFYGDGSKDDFMDLLKKHKEERYLLPCSDIHRKDIVDFLEKNKFSFSEAVIYKTVLADLKGIKDINFDIIVFFSPSGVKSFQKNFPKFKQHHIKIAAFGPTTSQAVIDAGLRLDIKAPIPQAPSMAMAIEEHIKNVK